MERELSTEKPAVDGVAMPFQYVPFTDLGRTTI